MNTLFDISARVIRNTSLDFVRHCGSEMNWETPLMAIRGQKGVGKSTIMLQYIKSHYQPKERSVLYCS